MNITGYRQEKGRQPHKFCKELLPKKYNDASVPILNANEEWNLTSIEFSMFWLSA